MGSAQSLLKDALGSSPKVATNELHDSRPVT